MLKNNFMYLYYLLESVEKKANRLGWMCTFEQLQNKKSRKQEFPKPVKDFEASQKKRLKQGAS